MPDKVWKQAERGISAFFGTVRNPLSGEMSKHTSSDTLHPRLFVEAKYRKRHTTWSLWRDAKDKADKENKLPVLALKEKGKHGFLVVVRSSDLNEFIKIYKESTDGG